MLDGIIVSHDDDGVLIFAVDLFDQFQYLLGCFIIQSPCRLIAKKNIRILDDGSADSLSLIHISSHQ